MEAPLTIPIDSFWETQWWCLVNNVISVPIATIIMCIIYVWIKRHWCFASFVIWWFLKKSTNTGVVHPVKSIPVFYKKIKHAIYLAEVKLAVPINNQDSPPGVDLYPCSKEFYQYTFHLVNALRQSVCSHNIVNEIEALEHYDPSIKERFFEEYIQDWNKSHEIETEQEEFESFYMSYHDFMNIFHHDLNGKIRHPLPD